MVDLSTIPGTPPEGVTVKEVREIFTPHPYMVGPGHVAQAADHHGGVLGEEALDACHKKGILCCDKDEHGHRCTLSWREHKKEQALILVCPRNDKAYIRGIWDYLCSIKDWMLENNIDGVAFAVKGSI